MENNKVLIYVGASKGSSLYKMYKNFGSVHAFEPLPDNFAQLSKTFKNTHVTLNNCACDTADGESDFYITSYHNSSSLSPINEEYLLNEKQRKGGTVVDKIQVKTINLFNYLQKHDIRHIDTLVTDCQGSDLTVLKTVVLKQNIVIDTIITETHQNNKMLYKNLDNQFDKHIELLKTKYDFLYGIIDGHNEKLSQIQLLNMPQIKEWNSYWSKKI